MAYTSINTPTDYFNTVLYTGTGATQSITGVGFQPDLTWCKARNSGITYHQLTNSLRGTNKQLFSNIDDAEDTNTGKLTSFDSDGFTLGSNGGINGNTLNYVSWNWLGGGAAVSNTDGSITSSVSANTTSGFSIVNYTGTGSGATVGHGLGSAPKMVICKTLSTAGDWNSWHTGFSIQAKIALNTTEAIYNPGNGLYWNSTLPTSSVFSVGTSGNTNGNGTTYISYCFAEKKGFSKFGSYTGNGNANGPMIYTGFKPAWVMVKETTNVNSWRILDNKRDPYNVMTKALLANLTNAEVTVAHNTDYVSNGFKIRDSDTNMNRSGGTFVYMAFAESPFTTSTGIPTTAR